MNPIQEGQTINKVAALYLLKLQAINQYEFFAKQAQKDGYQQISAIFTETHTQMRNHAKTLFRFLEDSEPTVNLQVKSPGIGDTTENLMAAVANEKDMLTLLKQCEDLACQKNRKR